MRNTPCRPAFPTSKKLNLDRTGTRQRPIMNSMFHRHFPTRSRRSQTSTGVPQRDADLVGGQVIGFETTRSRSAIARERSRHSASPRERDCPSFPMCRP